LAKAPIQAPQQGRNLFEKYLSGSLVDVFVAFIWSEQPKWYSGCHPVVRKSKIIRLVQPEPQTAASGKFYLARR
jgi:hypothetical protein